MDRTAAPNIRAAASNTPSNNEREERAFDGAQLDRRSKVDARPRLARRAQSRPQFLDLDQSPNRPWTLQGRSLISDRKDCVKQFRAIATRYDNTARNFFAAIHLAAATIS